MVPAALVVLAVVGLTAIVAWRRLHEPAEAAGPTLTVNDDPVKAHGPAFTVSRQTTHVTGPLDQHGYVDYPAALNERLGKGVTPESNANVLLWKALGPTPDGSKRMPARFFELLGAKEPPEKGEYFIGLKEFVRDRLKIDDPDAAKPFEEELRRLARSPWSSKDHAQIAAWLTANQKPLALGVEASKRPDYYSPTMGTSILASSDPVMWTGRELAHALASRAMLEVNDGKPGDAWQDLLACHRLARLLGRGRGDMAFLTGIGLDQVAAAADVAYLDRARLSGRQIQDCSVDLRALPPIPVLADCVDLSERFEFLNEMMLFAKHGFWYVEQLAGGKAEHLMDEPVPNVNWDPGLRAANQWFGAVVAAMRDPDRPTRRQRLERIEADLKKRKSQVTREECARAVLDVGLSPDAKGEFCGELLLGLINPAVVKVQQAADRYEQAEQNFRVAFALAAHRADHKNYPKALADLVPKYLDKIPDDLFTGKPLIYRLTEKGFLLYSLGPNGKDDDGHGPGDDPKGDDIAVRIPVPAK
jgi:hypothetical protein